MKRVLRLWKAWKSSPKSHTDQNEPHHGRVVQDAQGRRWKLLSPTQMLTGEQQQHAQVVNKKRKCHGNRKLQHFKRKCRVRGLTQKQITVLIDKRNHAISELLRTDRAILEQTHELHKRKRDDLASTQESLDSSMKSMSQLPISQAVVTKKSKHSTAETTSTIHEVTPETDAYGYNLHKPSKYLRMPQRLLLH